jgi:hypothetical protein
MVVQAKAHGVYEVFDPTYNPQTPVEIELFELKQIFVFSVFNRVCLTDQGKGYVRKYALNSDAQKVFRDMIAFAMTSTAASNEKQELTVLLTTIRYDQTWKGTSIEFLHFWHSKMTTYEDMTDLAEHYSDSVKLRMVQTALQNSSAFENVREMDQLRISAGGNALTYEVYWEALLSTATQLDKRVHPGNAISKRTVNTTDHLYEPNVNDFYDSGDLRNDVIVNTTSLVNNPQANIEYQAYHVFSQDQQQRQYLPRDEWDKLSPDAKIAMGPLNSYQNTPRPLNANPPKTNATHAYPPPNAMPEINVHDFEFSTQEINAMISNGRYEASLQAILLLFAVLNWGIEFVNVVSR